MDGIKKNIPLEQVQGALIEIRDLFFKQPSGNKDDALIESVVKKDYLHFSNCSRYKRLILEYGRYKIKETFGLTLNEYTNLPRYKMDKIIEVAIILQEENKNILDKVLGGDK